ncbi:ArsR/SmtB family transcription factor [Kitasatospora sp. NPDC052896]|uniref:ArsR/SmtB family transcription factor n=1 Tax=Kitasatospora sp. NPDC052896 TaxID=3364061 RepID=UPI0037CADB62
MSDKPMRGLVELEELDRVFSALAHRTRRAILLVLHTNGGAMTSGAIANLFTNTWQTTSRHLRLLEEAGLIEVKLQGRERVYRLRADRLDGLVSGWLHRFT